MSSGSGAEGAARGFWDTLGTPAAVDWCEPNYAVSAWVAEFWNTLSSLVIFAAGAYGLWRWWQHRDQLEPRFGVCFAGLAAVGLGSTLFHGTLLKLPQASDELPMIWLSLACFYCLVARRAETPKLRRKRWGWGLLAYALVFNCAYFVVKDYFVLFLVSYAAVVAYVCIATWRLAYREVEDPRLRRLFWWSVGAYMAGFFLMWIPERTVGCEHAFQQIQPHAWFHISGAVGPYAWVLLAALDRLLRLDRPAEIGGRPIAYVRPA